METQMPAAPAPMDGATHVGPASRLRGVWPTVSLRPSSTRCPLRLDETRTMEERRSIGMKRTAGNRRRAVDAQPVVRTREAGTSAGAARARR